MGIAVGGCVRVGVGTDVAVAENAGIGADAEVADEVGRGEVAGEEDTAVALGEGVAVVSCGWESGADMGAILTRMEVTIWGRRVTTS
jgi:hypothetical protein